MRCKPPLILLYHKIKEVDSKSSLCVTPADFKAHLKYLLKNNFHIISFYDILSNLKFDTKTAVITFDDGYRNNYLSAYPVLAEFKIPATIFIVTGLIGQRSIWDEKDGWPSDELLTWPEIKEMDQKGIVIGSHSHNHYYLTKMKWWPNIWHQVKYSKKIIEEKLNKKVLFFSYPFGRSNVLIRQMVKKAGYLAACGSSLANNKPADIYNQLRLEINTANSPIDKFVNLINNCYLL